MTPEIVSIHVNRNDIFAYVVGNSNYDPIECCIDPTLFEVFEEFIYDSRNKKQIPQNEEYTSFCKQVSSLRKNAKNMHPSEILRICEELEEIAPKTITL